MRRRTKSVEDELTDAGIPLVLTRFRSEEWPPSTAVPDDQGLTCTDDGPFHAGCRYWATYQQWHRRHPDVDMPLHLINVDAAWHDEHL